MRERAAHQHRGDRLDQSLFGSVVAPLALAPDQVVAISHYSHEQGGTSIPLRLARRYRATAGTAEEVIAQARSRGRIELHAQTTLGAYRRAPGSRCLRSIRRRRRRHRDQIRSVAAAVGARAAASGWLRGSIARWPTPRRGWSPTFGAALYFRQFRQWRPQLVDRDGRARQAGRCEQRFRSRLFGRCADRKPGRASAADRDRPDPNGRTASLRRRVLGMAGLSGDRGRFPRQLVNSRADRPSFPRARSPQSDRERCPTALRLRLLIALITAGLFALSLMAGKQWIPSDAWFGHDPRERSSRIAHSRAVLGVLIGAALGLSGGRCCKVSGIRSTRP